MANDEAKRLHPTCPHLAPRTFKDNSANELTKAIVKYLTLKGGFASRVNSTGVYDRRLGKYRTGTQKRGIADIMAIYKGLSLQIEVKYGKDRQSEVQKQVEQEVIRSGGRYYLARNFTDFKAWFDTL
jgi:Holliday junction resolvase